MREEIIIYKEYYDLLKLLPDDEWSKTWYAIVENWFHGTSPEGLSEKGMTVFNLIMDKMVQREKNAERQRRHREKNHAG